MNCDVLVYCHKFLQVWTVLIILLNTTISGYNSNKIAKPQSLNQTTPEFGDMEITEIDGVVGQTLLLPCTVKNVGDKVVSWIRTRDLHILTSGALTFSADSRFESVHSSNGDFWGLRLRGARIADTGQYECQVNTDPKMSLAINLVVTEKLTTHPKVFHVAKILGSEEVSVQERSTVIFTCEVSLFRPSGTQDQQENSLPARSRVKWFHGDEELSFESDRGGVSVETEYTDQKIYSRLRLASVTYGDGGDYTCKHPTSLPATVTLFVLESEHSEAMQRDFPNPSSRGACRFSSGMFSVKYILLFSIYLYKL